MPTISSENIADLLTNTAAQMDEPQFTQIATELQDYPGARQLLRKKRATFDSGDRIERRLMTGTGGSAKHFGFFETDTGNVPEKMQLITVDWRGTTANYVIERREIKINRGKRKIVDLLVQRRLMALIDLTELIEETIWSIPSSDDDITPYGLLYWLTYNTSTGFNGGNHSNFSSGPGTVSASAFPNWSNWTAQYSAVTKGDLVTLMRECFVKTKWKNPHDFPESGRGMPDTGIYCPYAVYKGLEDIGEQQNDSLGKDIASMDGQIRFRGNDITWVPQLDALTTSLPLYLVDWSVFYPFFLEGEFFVQSPLKVIAGQHTTFQSFTDMTWNTLCTNRRKNGLIAKADPSLGV